MKLTRMIKFKTSSGSPGLALLSPLHSRITSTSGLRVKVSDGKPPPPPPPSDLPFVWKTSSGNSLAFSPVNSVDRRERWLLRLGPDYLTLITVSLWVSEKDESDPISGLIALFPLDQTFPRSRYIRNDVERRPWFWSAPREASNRWCVLFFTDLDFNPNDYITNGRLTLYLKGFLTVYPNPQTGPSDAYSEFNGELTFSVGSGLSTIHSDYSLEPFSKGAGEFRFIYFGVASAVPR